jgi:hypothetical protein
VSLVILLVQLKLWELLLVLCEIYKVIPKMTIMQKM